MNTHLADKKLFGALPDELDPLNELELEGVRFRLRVESRRYGKLVTVLDVEGWPREQVKNLSQELKSLIGTGGTFSESSVELQGDHKRRVKEYLTSKGYEVES